MVPQPTHYESVEAIAEIIWHHLNTCFCSVWVMPSSRQFMPDSLRSVTCFVTGWRDDASLERRHIFFKDAREGPTPVAGSIFEVGSGKTVGARGSRIAATFASTRTLRSTKRIPT